jgi:hypothetical protein
MEYTIEKVSDFLKIPEDKIDICLDEFKAGLKSCHGMITLIKATGKAMDTPIPDAAILFPKMVWKDDGENNLTFKLNGVPSQSSQALNGPGDK